MAGFVTMVSGNLSISATASMDGRERIVLRVSVSYSYDVEIRVSKMSTKGGTKEKTGRIQSDQIK